MQTEDSSLFNLTSFELYNNDGGHQFNLQGQYEDGSTVDYSTTTSGFHDLTGLGFENLVSANFSMGSPQTDVRIDNINASPVPEPCSLTMALLGGLLLLRHKRRRLHQ